MMFGGGMFLMGLLALAVVAVPVIILIVAASGGLAQFNSRPVVAQSHGPGPHTPVLSSKRCPNCGQSLQADWRLCPYDGTEVG